MFSLRLYIIIMCQIDKLAIGVNTETIQHYAEKVTLEVGFVMRIRIFISTVLLAIRKMHLIIK